MPVEWDAATYDRIADPQERWAMPVLDRLPLRGDERVLDAGCGTGRVTSHLVERLPRGRVVALDGSAAMLDQARQRLGDSVDFVLADLGQPLPVEPPVDAVFSTATFHWVADHDALFTNLAAVLRPGGALVAQCGGHGNVAGPLRAAAELGVTSDHPKTFATAEETAARLASAGFTDVWTWLHPEYAAFDSVDDLETFLLTVVLRTHVEGMGDAERHEFARAVIERLPGGRVDYVRLNILARRQNGRGLLVPPRLAGSDAQTSPLLAP